MCKHALFIAIQIKTGFSSFADEEIVKIANDSSKPNHLELLDYRDEYYGLVDCLNGKPSNYQNIYESLIKRGFKITHWQPTTKEDFWNEKHPYIMITWM